jgi:O-methyltransferase
MNPIGALRSQLHRRRDSRRQETTFQRFAEFTMIPRETYFANLALAERARPVPGCVIECGVWRGGMSAGLVSVLGPERAYFLFDSFEGLPAAAAIDGAAAIAWQKDTGGRTYYDNCSAAPEFAERAMRLAGATAFTLVRGWFNSTVPAFVPPAPIALLRLDGDWYESTMTCLDGLFDHVAPGGLIVLDDYYAWDGCSRAVHDFLSKRKATERIDSLEGVCFIQKSAGAPPAAP